MRTRNVGQAIVDEARRRRAEIIVLGADQRKRGGERMFGRVIDYVLRNADCRVMVGAGRQIGSLADSVKAAQRAVASHERPYVASAAVSVGVHSGEAGIGLLGPAILRCEELCDAAEGGQIFLSQATASLLEDESLGEFMVRDIGEREMRRTRGRVRAYDLVFPPAGESAGS